MQFAVFTCLLLLTPKLAHAQSADVPPCSSQANGDDSSRSVEPCDTPGVFHSAKAKGFQKPVIKCPQGTQPVPSQGLQSFRCARAAAAKPTRAPSGNVVAVGYAEYAVADEFVCQYPHAMSPHDEWNDDVPTLSFLLDSHQTGKPIVVTITKFARSQASYVTISEAIAKDKNWLKAKESAPVSVSGVKARVTIVRGASKTAYIPLDNGAYYTLTYSAPEDAYDEFLVVFDRMLNTFSFRRTQD